MKKNNLIVMLIVFVVLIFLTPMIFGKFMNSKFNEMIKQIQQKNNIEIKQLKDNSSYLTTEKVYEITVPGKSFDLPYFKYIKLKTTVDFKNLPISNVVFHNVVTNISLDGYRDVKELSNKFKFDVITSDFKHYKYKIIDNKIDKNGVSLSWKSFKGTFTDKKDVINSDGILSLNVINDNKEEEGKISLNHIFFSRINKSNKIISKFKLKECVFKAYNSSVPIVANLENLEENDLLIDNGKTYDVSSEIKTGKLDVNRMVTYDLANFSLKINGLDKESVKVLSKGKKSQLAVMQLIDNGISGNFKLNVKNLVVMMPLGEINAQGSFKLEKGNNYDNFNKDNFDSLSAEAKITVSQQFVDMIRKYDPRSASMFELNGDKAILNIKVYKGHIFVNGNEIK